MQFELVENDDDDPCQRQHPFCKCAIKDRRLDAADRILYFMCRRDICKIYSRLNVEIKEHRSKCFI